MSLFNRIAKFARSPQGRPARRTIRLRVASRPLARGAYRFRISARRL